MSYSAKYMDHFTNPRGVGALDPHDAVSEVEHSGSGCFDRVKLMLNIDAQKISEVKFQARACSGTIAACSALVEMINGMELDKARMVKTEDLITYLDGVPDKKRHSVELAAEALQEALKSVQ